MSILPDLFGDVKKVAERTAVNFGNLLHTDPAQSLENGFAQASRGFADKILGRSTITRQPAPTPAAPSYQLPSRGVGLNDQDLGELRNVLYAEISNRDPEKQKLESKVIINTALNRISQYKQKGRDLSLSDVLREPNQYQGYNPDNPKSQYNVAKSGKFNAAKMSAIDAILGDLKKGAFDDNTGGAVFYKHNTDGSIVFDNKTPLYQGNLAKSKDVAPEGGPGAMRDMSQDSIRTYDMGDKLANLVEKIKENVPFVDSNFEKAIRQSVTDAFPLTDQAKGVLSKVDIRNRPLQILSPFFHSPVAEETGSADAGISGLFTRAMGDTRAKLTDALLPVINKLPDGAREKVAGTIAGEHISLDDLAPPVAAHETMHAIFARKDINPEEFNKDWEAAKKESPDSKMLLDYIEKHMNQSGAYEGLDPYGTANERYAYLVEFAGADGYDTLPKPLQQYYKDVLKPHWDDAASQKKADTGN